LSVEGFDVTPANKLMQFALGISSDTKQRATELKPDLEKLEARKMEIEERLRLADLAYQRIATFKQILGTDLCCPRCWLLSEKKFLLKPIASSGSERLFACETCQHQFDLSE
jgi:hypothetical protein